MGFFSKLNEKALKYCEESEQPQKKHLEFPKNIHPSGNAIEHLVDTYREGNMDNVLAANAPTLTGMLEEVYNNQAKYAQYNELEGRYNELREHYNELQKRYDELVKAMSIKNAATAQN